MEWTDLLDKYNITDLFFFKFGKREYNQEIVDGKLYLNTVDFFRGLEDEQKRSRGVADKYDSCFFTSNGRLEIHDKSDDAVVGAIDFTSSMLKLCGDKLLFCLYTMGRSNIYNAYIGDKGESLFVEAQFTEQQKRDIMEHFPEANSALLIPNNCNLIRNIEKAALKNDGKLKSGKVRYRESKLLTLDLFDDLDEDTGRLAFYKDMFFSPQQEFRMLFDPMSLRDGNYLDFEKPDGNQHLFEIDELFNTRFVIKFSILLQEGGQ